MPKAPAAGPAEVDAYLAALPDDQRALLAKLRETIRAAAPSAVETISYQMPAFKLHGRFLVSYAGFSDHCSLFPASGQVLDEHGDAVKAFRTGKGTLQFTVDHPIPITLVRKIVKTRVAEVEAAEAASKAKRGR
ncbi:MAG TPA: DUF1801 domain-containing protein [Actinomycetota bacterium]|nr:DUF1801 domain-containing protein [Actinomycetota bacterium]